MPATRLRPGRPEDAPALLALHRAAILTLGRAAYSAAECESWAAGLTEAGYVRAMADERYIVAVDGAGALLGFASHRGEEVMGLYVAPGAARQGIGRRLLAAAESAIADAGHDRVRIGAALSAEAFYRAAGYRVIAPRPWRTRGGLTIRTLDMARDLAR
ncbi:MAG: GNAT family N-acetyltransferase [Pseudomonadota bacterium]